MVRLLDYARLSARQLIKKRTRILLTALGIAIGIAAVVGIVSLGEGIRNQAIETVKQQSDLSLIEVTGAVREGTVIPVTESKLALINTIPHVEAAGPVYRASFSTLRQTYLGVTGFTADDFTRIFSPAYSQGGFPESGTNEVLLGYDIAEKLRKYEGIRQGDLSTVVIREYDPSGAPKDRKLAIRISGVLKERGDQLDTMVIMDRDAVKAMAGDDISYGSVYVRVDNPENVFAVVASIQSLGLGATGAFQQIESVNRFMDLIILFLSLFAAISLVVGALMIVNTMVMSVYERTREIGVSMAVGASRGDVMTLILFECFYIGVIGGVLGDLIGIVFSFAINVFGKPYLMAQMGDLFSGFARYDLTIVTPGILISGFLVAVILSLAAGMYPAMKAAGLDPVEAIHHA